MSVLNTKEIMEIIPHRHPFLLVDKMCIRDRVRRIIKDHPVLLLDDVLSELDSNRQNYLLQSIHEIQTMITCTGLDEFIQNQFDINRVFRVIDGNVFKNN